MPLQPLKRPTALTEQFPAAIDLPGGGRVTLPVLFTRRNNASVEAAVRKDAGLVRQIVFLFVHPQHFGGGFANEDINML